MTIKQFALLCGCNPQTLRYYDHVDLSFNPFDLIASIEQV